MKKYIAFDLDGTLMDTMKGMTKALNNTMQKFLYPYKYEEADVKKMIGRGAEILFKLATKKDEINKKEFSFYLKEYEKEQYISSFYEGVIETLNYLKNKGYKILIYTNKPDKIMRKLIKKKSKDFKFDFVLGRTKKFPRKPDVEGLKYCLKELKLNIKDGYYVGDSITDIETARNANIDCVLCEYGYENYDAIKKEKVFKRIKTFSDLQNIF